MRKRWKKEILALRSTPIKSIIAKLPNNNIESNGKGIFISTLWRNIV
jgi:hypothetical protein